MGFQELIKKATKCHVYFLRVWDNFAAEVKRKDFTFCLQDTRTICNTCL